MNNPSRTRKWGRRVVKLILILALIFGLRAWQQHDIVTGLAPELDGVLLDGQPVSLTELRGKPVLVHFWATWCPVCALEEDTINAVAQDHTVITVAMQSGNGAEVLSHLRENKPGFPVLNDPQGLYSARWGVQAVPTSFIIDARGRIRFTEVGYTTEAGLRGRLWFAGEYQEAVRE